MNSKFSTCKHCKSLTHNRCIKEDSLTDFVCKQCFESSDLDEDDSNLILKDLSEVVVEDTF